MKNYTFYFSLKTNSSYDSRGAKVIHRTAMHSISRARVAVKLLLCVPLLSLLRPSSRWCEEDAAAVYFGLLARHTPDDQLATATTPSCPRRTCCLKPRHGAATCWQWWWQVRSRDVRHEVLKVLPMQADIRSTVIVKEVLLLLRWQQVDAVVCVVSNEGVTVTGNA